MMQNSPLLVTKVNSANKPRDVMVNEKQPAEENQTFKQMLSKQVEQSETKSADDKQTKAKDKASAEAEQSQTTLGSAAPIPNMLSGEQELASDTDAQQLASEVTAKTVKDVTDGAVDLDVVKQTVNTQTSIANVTPNATVLNKSTDNKLEAADSRGVNDQIIKTGFTNLSSLTQPKVAVDVNAKVSSDMVNTATIAFNNSIAANSNPEKDIAKAKVDIKDNAILQKTEAGLDVAALGKDKFASQLNIEKNIQLNQESVVTQSSNNIADATSALVLAAQASGKQPSPLESTQSMLSNYINVSPGKPGWSEAVGQKVAWMVGANEQSATLTLNPKDLGPLQIIINVNNEKADATFISDNPEVRKALEDGMSNLKQSMSQAGVELGQANVNTGKEHQAFHQANQGYSQKQASIAKESQATENVLHQSVVARVSNGLVDTFA
ncbi:MAG: flagellar hook-length control protein FliK [Methylotenera sp.]